MENPTSQSERHPRLFPRGETLPHGSNRIGYRIMSEPYGPRRRYKKDVRTLSGTHYFKNAGVTQASSGDSISLHNGQFMRDEVFSRTLLHHALHETLDIGGPLDSLKAEHIYPVACTHASSGPVFGALEWSWEGPVTAYPMYAWTRDYSQADWESTYANMVDSLDLRIAMGGTAIERCRPASPEASLGVALVELRNEGIPKILPIVKNLKGDVDFFRSLGGNYLNVEFGWKPFVSDLKAAAQAIMNQEALVNELQRNSGKRMRRHYRFPVVTSTELLVQDNIGPWPNLNSYVLSQARREVTLTKTKETWFSGEFTYHYPLDNAQVPEKAIAWARHILGVDLTPETVWNATPWTWLFDWFANVGDFWANMSAIGWDGLAMHYGYLMQKSVWEYEHEHFGVYSPNSSNMPSHIRGTTRFTAKSRIRASPYGFGITWDGFSPRQIAILAALGITRGRTPSQG